MENDIFKQPVTLKSVLTSMLNAFVIFDSVFDESGTFVSYRFVFINDAYERITGVKNDDVKGKTVHEVWPETEDSWIQKYGHVAVTGETLVFENYHDPTKKLYHCRVFRPWDTKDRFCVIFDDITEQKRAEAELKKIEWLLEKEQKNDEKSTAAPYAPSYGDVTKLNTERTILDSIDGDIMRHLADDLMDLLGTSLAVYEKNGDYAFGLFQSGWCQIMDAASRRLCGTDDNKAALAGGKWLCHENCWNDSAKAAIETGRTTDIDCVGGIKLFAEPIFAGDDIVGSVNIGYGDPPLDAVLLKKLAKEFNEDIDVLQKSAEEYKPRPPFVIDAAKKRLKSIALLIGSLVYRRKMDDEIRKRMKELEIFNEAAVDREIVINDHRKEINALLKELGRKPRYKIAK